MEEPDAGPVKGRVKRSWYVDGGRQSWRQRQKEREREGFEGKKE